MGRDYNEMAFTPEDVEKGLHLGLINYLLHYNTKSDGYYNEIRITSDGYCTIIQWVNVPYDHEFGGSFKFVDEDEEVLKDVEFPDGHFEYVHPEDKQLVIDEWVKEHPEYYMNRWGQWVNREEYESISDELQQVPVDYPNEE